MSNIYRTGAHVRWTWGKGTGAGKVLERFDRRVQRTIQGEKVVRKGSKDNPAYLIDADGSRVLKLGSELSAA